MIFKKIILILLVLIFSANSYAAEYYQFIYKIKKEDTFSEILKKFVKLDSVINARTPMVKKIIRENQNIKDWRKLPEGESIQLFVSSDFIDLKKYENYKEENLQALKNVEEKNQVNDSPVGLKGSIFYMASIGNFTQTAKDVAEISFKQNSPVSLGTSFSFYPKNKHYSFSFSTYYSHLLASASNLTSETISIPPEIGGNIFGEYRLEKSDFILYAGPDYEKFSAFNLRGLQNDKKVYVDKINITYLTVGVAKSYMIFDKLFFTKIGLSKTLLSQYQANAPVSESDASDFIDNGKYTGFRLLLYLNYKISQKFYIHSLFKYHTLSGPSDLSSLRIGVGVGYILF